MSLHRSLLSPNPAWLLSTLLLAACGGGSSNSLSNGTLFSGSVIDAPIPGAYITITANAPLGQAGATTLATTTADSSASYNVTVTLPSGNIPIYITATTPNNSAIFLSSYVGTASVLAQSASVTSTTVPNLTVSQVTTAALALIQAQNPGLLSKMTPSDYDNVINSQNNQLITLAAGIQAVADGHCGLGRKFRDTQDMAEQIASAALTASASTTSASNSAILSQTSTLMPSNCQGAVQTLMQTIPATAIWGSQLMMGSADPGNNSATTPNYTGTFQLQGYVLDTGLVIPATPTDSGSTDSSSSSSVAAPLLPTAASNVPFPVLLNNSITINSSGVVSSTDKSISGTLTGASLLLQVSLNNQNYQLSARIEALPSALLQTNSPAVYRMEGGGSNTTNNDAVRLNAILASSGASPNWTALGTQLTSDETTPNCPSGSTPIRMTGAGMDLGAMRFPMCLSSSATGFTLNVSTSTNTEIESFLSAVLPSGFTFPSLTMAETTSGSTPSAFVLSSTPTTLTVNGTSLSMTAYYVLGSHEMFYNLASAPGSATTGSAATSNATSYNGSLMFDGEFLAANSGMDLGATPAITTGSNAGGVMNNGMGPLSGGVTGMLNKDLSSN